MKQIFAILTGLTLVYLMTVVFANSVMEDLSSNIIRLHIVANSDTEDDQSIKLKIRDEILKADMNITDKSSAVKNLRKAESIATKILSENGFSYGAKADFGIFEFPEKSYDGITLPKGNYSGLKIVLGDGLGQNWWCILSPPACIMDGCVTFDDLPLKSRLDDTTYSLISGDFRYKSKILEFFQKAF